MRNQSLEQQPYERTEKSVSNRAAGVGACNNRCFSASQPCKGDKLGVMNGDNFTEYGCVRRQSSGPPHVLLRLRVPKHCPEIRPTSPRTKIR